MRVPIRTEREAFRFVFGTVALIAISVVVGLLAEPSVGVALFGFGALVALAAYLGAGNPDRITLGDAEHEPHPHGPRAGARHLLVVANEALAGDELRERITGENGEHIEIDVLAPVLTSHLHYAMSDIDKELSDAHARLRRSLSWARECGIVARGEVGDPNPTTALADQLRDFGADEVIVVTHPRERETWQERGELDHLRHELDVPVTHFVVDDSGAATAAT